MGPESDFELRKFVAPEFLFGVGARKVLVVTDPGVIAAGWTGKVLAIFDEHKIPYAVISHVTPNSLADEVIYEEAL